MAYKNFNLALSKSFTPSINFGGGSTGITYTTQSGSYTRIGNIIFFSINIELSSKGTSTGVAFIGGFPTNAVAGQGTLTIPYASSTITSGYDNMVTIIAPGNWALFYSNTTSGALTNVQDTNFTNTSIIRFNGFYFV